MHGSSSPPRLGVLFSGGGRTLLNIARRIEEGSLRARIAVAVSSHNDAAGIARAREAGIRTEVVDYREAGAALTQRILDILDASGAEWVILAGFVRYFDVPPRLAGKVLNIHPALLPACGGKGFYGHRVHEAVLKSGARLSGCTVHFVDREYDRGPIILQRVVPVANGDTPETLAERVFVEECIAYPDAIRLVTEGRVTLDAAQRALLRPDAAAAAAGLPGAGGASSPEAESAG